MSLEVREVGVEPILDLRHRVLRTGLPRQTAHFPGDELLTTRHFAVYEGDQVVGCATFLETQRDGEPAWQLRGMATDPARQGQGVGRVLVEQATAALSARGSKSYWCNARTSAVGFYQRIGWETVGPEFQIEGVGPHYIMVWRRA
jgi:predicted GNAT family N-acyltransferase